MDFQNTTRARGETQLETGGSSSTGISYSEPAEESLALSTETNEEEFAVVPLEEGSIGSKKLTKALNGGDNGEAACVKKQDDRAGLPLFMCPDTASFVRLLETQVSPYNSFGEYICEMDLHIWHWKHYGYEDYYFSYT